MTRYSASMVRRVVASRIVRTPMTTTHGTAFTINVQSSHRAFFLTIIFNYGLILINVN
jgi:hypothetical protein